MNIERTIIHGSSFSTVLHILTVIGLWFLACSVDKIPPFRDTMNFV